MLVVVVVLDIHVVVLACLQSSVPLVLYWVPHHRARSHFVRRTRRGSVNLQLRAEWGRAQALQTGVELPDDEIQEVSVDPSPAGRSALPHLPGSRGAGGATLQSDAAAAPTAAWTAGDSSVLPGNRRWDRLRLNHGVAGLREKRIFVCICSVVHCLLEAVLCGGIGVGGPVPSRGLRG